MKKGFDKELTNLTLSWASQMNKRRIRKDERIMTEIIIKGETRRIERMFECMACLCVFKSTDYRFYEHIKQHDTTSLFIPRAECPECAQESLLCPDVRFQTIKASL